MSNLSINFNTPNLFNSGIGLPAYDFSSSFSGFSNSLFNFQFPLLQPLNFGNFKSFDTNDSHSMYKGSVAKANSFDSNNYFDFMPALSNDFELTTPAIDYTLNPFGKKSKSSSINGEINYQITDLNTKTTLPEISGFYNPDKGLKLAQTTASRIAGSFTGNCATYVKNGILYSGLGKYEFGDAYKTADILRKNSNFKEVKVNPNDLSKLPAGCVLVYDKGAAGYNKNFGHVEVTLGNGKAASDFITNNIRSSEHLTVFVPV